MRRTLAALLLSGLLLVLPGTASAAAPDVQAGAVMLLDGENGQVLYSLNAQTRMYPASTTKVLTALVALEHARLTDVFTVGPHAVQLPWDSTLAGLRPGEQLSLEQLLYGLLLPSGNDAAVAIAEGISGSETTFADLMNQKAAQLGASHSHFANASGLHNQQHYTTAADLAIIARAAFANSVLVHIAQTQEYLLPNNRKLTNGDGLLGFYDGLVGAKTGFTEQAGRTLVSEARRNGRTLVGVVLNSRLRYTDMIHLLDHGFKDFNRSVLVRAGESVGNVGVSSGAAPGVAALASKDITYDVSADSTPNIVRQTFFFPDLKAPVLAGQKVGEVALSVGGAEIGRVDLLASVAVTYQRPLAALVSQAAQVAQVSDRARSWSALPAWARWSLTAMAFMLMALGRLLFVATRRRRRRLRRLRLAALSEATLRNRSVQQGEG